MSTKQHFSIFFIAIFAVVSILPICAQSSKKEKTPPEIIESALLRVIYTFSQQAEKDREPIILTDTMALVVGQTHSVYYDWNKERRDSINNKKMDIPMEKIKSINVMKDESLLQSRLEMRQEPTFISDESKGESAKLYKNRETNEVITMDKGPSEGLSNPVQTYLQVKEPITQDWTITEDTLTVLNYPCQKATTKFRGRNYSAWFTLDIPIGDGPWKLCGLPGMILKAEDANGIFHFQAIGIEQTPNETVNKPTDRKIVPSTLKKLKEYRKNRFKNLRYGFFDGSTLNMYQGRNSIVFNELEIIE